jgi:cytochrome b pre-mRNA-processing protein 3
MRWPLFRREELADAGPLYAAVVAEARRPAWYRDGAVADSMEGRFAVLATLLALADLRLGEGGDTARALAPRLTELFVADMDAQLRETGLGDPGLGKQVRRMVGSLAGRIERWRSVAAGGDEHQSLRDSLYRDDVAPDGAAMAAAAELLRSWRERLAAADDDMLARGEMQ